MTADQLGVARITRLSGASLVGGGIATIGLNLAFTPLMSPDSAFR